MVIRDKVEPNFTQEKVRESSQLHELMARPIDRLAAFVIDHLILLLPVIYLVLAPFQKSTKLAAMTDNEWQLNISMILGVLAVVAVVMAYQSITTWLWGSTPGQFFLGLRVVSIWPNRRVTLTQALVRSAYWLGSLVLLGLPFLAIFSNLMRRPIHDRITDVIVVTVRKNQNSVSPTGREMSLVKGVYASVGVFIFVGLFSAVVTSLVRMQKQEALISQLEDEDVLCAVISDAQSEWPVTEDESEPDRLTVALTLFAAEEIDIRCLEAEVKYLFSDEEESPMLSLVKSFVYFDQPELSNRYLDNVCAQDKASSECEMSQMISTATTENPKADLKLRLDLLSENPPAYLAVWAVKKYLALGDYKGAEKYLKLIPYHNELVNFTLPVTAKVLWHNKKQKEAEGLALAAYNVLPTEAKLDVASFMCFEQIWNDCSYLQSSGCSQLGELTKESVELSSPQTSIAYLQKWECENQNVKNPKYESLLSLNLQDDVRQLVLALNEEGTDGFSELLEDEALNSELKHEVTRRLVQRARSVGLLKVIETEWAAHSPSPAWMKVGRTLFDKFYSMKEFVASLKVASFIEKTNVYELDQDLLQKSVVAAVKAGQYQRGSEFLKNYLSQFPSPLELSGDRGLASSSEFIEAVRTLKEVEK